MLRENWLNCKEGNGILKKRIVTLILAEVVLLVVVVVLLMKRPRGDIAIRTGNEVEVRRREVVAGEGSSRRNLWMCRMKALSLHYLVKSRRLRRNLDL